MRERIRYGVLFLAVILLTVLLFVTRPPLPVADAPTNDLESPPVVQDTFIRGRVLEITEAEEKNEFGQTIFAQTLRVFLALPPASEPPIVTVAYEVNQAKQQLEVGDRVIMGKTVRAEGDTLYYVSDVYRLRSIWLILAFFFFITVLFGRGRGFMAFVGLAFSFVVIFAFIIPHILAGRNPFVISLAGTIMIACVSLYLAHGVGRRTSIALAATLGTTVLAFGLSILFVSLSHLFGLGTEEAFYLQYAPIPPIDPRGLLLGGIMIGVMGILDDITTAQTAAVEEIYKANPSLSVAELYRRGLSVGREHIISLVNTLVLAYTGASFPLLLIFVIYERPIWVTLNSELVMEEIIRTLVGSSTLILAVPITTFLAAIFVRRHTSQPPEIRSSLHS